MTTSDDPIQLALQQEQEWARVRTRIARQQSGDPTYARHLQEVWAPVTGYQTTTSTSTTVPSVGEETAAALLAQETTLDDDLRQALVDAGPDVAALLQQRCRVVRTVEVATSTGSRKTWETVGVDIPCLVTQTRNASAEAERIVGGREEVLVTPYRVLVPLDADVTNLDRLLLDDGRTLEILSAPTTTFQLVRRLVCREVS